MQDIVRLVIVCLSYIYSNNISITLIKTIWKMDVSVSILQEQTKYVFNVDRLHFNGIE